MPGWDGWLFSRGVLRFKNQQWYPGNLLQVRNDAEMVLKLENDEKIFIVCGFIVFVVFVFFSALIAVFKKLFS